jgi:hypothetical protein
VEKSIKAMEAVAGWVTREGDGDGDTWEGFFISVDMLTVDEDDDE